MLVIFYTSTEVILILMLKEYICFFNQLFQCEQKIVKGDLKCQLRGAAGHQLRGQMGLLTSLLIKELIYYCILKLHCSCKMSCAQIDCQRLVHINI